MSLKLVLPFGQKDTVKDLVFSILVNEYPLKLIELKNIMNKRYAKAVTFQSIRKSVLELLEQGVLIKENYSYKIDKEWVKEAKEKIDVLYQKIYREKTKSPDVDSIGGRVSVFSFENLNDMMLFWQDIIKDWFKNFKKGDKNINCYQAPHAWEALLHLDKEKNLMEKLKIKGIKSYILTTSNTPLDKQIWRFYKNIGINTGIKPSSKVFDRNYHVGTYGETIVQVKFPEHISKEIDDFFKANKHLEKINLEKLSDVVNKKTSVQMTVIKDEIYGFTYKQIDNK
jgi:hypothetical protein